jgi:outer membrane protein
MTNSVKALFLGLAAFVIFPGIPIASDQSGDEQLETRTMTVQEAVRMTLSHSPEALVAEAQDARARAALRESRTANLPRFYAGSGLAYNNGFPLSIEGAAPSIFQITANKPIFSKTNNNLIREAEESGKASQLSTESARSELASRTASVYYQLFQADKILALLSAKLDASLRQEMQLKALLEAGKVRPVDATLAKTAVLSARQRILVAKEEAAIADKELHKLTGLSDSVKIQTVVPIIENPIFDLQEEALFQQALQNSPSILQAQAEVRAKEFHVEAERGGYFPQMEIVGEYALLSRENNYEDYFNSFVRNNFLIGLSVKVPIFNGTVGARVAKSRQEASLARRKMESMKSDLKLDIQRRSGALRIARGAVDLGNNDVDAAREVVEVSETLMEAGRISEKDLEDSRAQLLEKELAILDADQALYQRKLDLLFSTGIIVTALQ